MDQHGNPYEPPSYSRGGEELLVPLEVHRAPLLAIENQAISYVFDWEFYSRLPKSPYQSWVGDTVENVLNHPTCIFEGLERRNFEMAICYCGIPGSYAMGSGIFRPRTSQVGLLFAEFDLAEQKIIVFNVCLRSEDRSRPGYPEDREFSKVLWP
jgi:hypothetical protein